MPNAETDLFYRKVFIKSGADLPKESGKYLVSSHFGSSDRDPYYRIYEVNRPAFKKFWLNYIDWYLQPEPEGKKSKAIDNTLKEYIQSEFKEGKIDFFIRTYDGKSFYICPEGKAGRTADFKFDEDVKTDYRIPISKQERICGFCSNWTKKKCPAKKLPSGKDKICESFELNNLFRIQSEPTISKTETIQEPAQRTAEADKKTIGVNYFAEDLIKDEARAWFKEHESEYKGIISRHFAIKMITDFAIYEAKQDHYWEEYRRSSLPSENGKQ